MQLTVIQYVFTYSAELGLAASYMTNILGVCTPVYKLQCYKARSLQCKCTDHFQPVFAISDGMLTICAFAGVLPVVDR